MQIPNELYNLLQSLCKSLNDVLKYPYISPTDKKLERFLYGLEKWRFEIYEQVRFFNNTNPENEIHFISNDYKANFKDNVLSLYIPEKLPTLKNKSSYPHNQIILNIAEITKPYQKLFYDKFVIAVVKIFEKIKVWDFDNRTIKPIQDGLIHGSVISDIAAFTNFSNTMNFIPSWHLKDRNSPTQDSRRYLGLLTFDQNFYTVYSVYGEKDDKYITSIYYDLKKEREIYNSIIFTNDIEKILYHKKRFWL